MIPSLIGFARTRAACAAVSGIALLALACQLEPESTAASPEGVANPGIERELVRGVPPGTEILVMREDGTSLRGRAVVIINADGTRIPGVFRGPAKLADIMSGGTHEFQAGQHSRLRVLEPGDSITVLRTIDGKFEREAPREPEREPPQDVARLGWATSPVIADRFGLDEEKRFPPSQFTLFPIPPRSYRTAYGRPGYH